MYGGWLSDLAGTEVVLQSPGPSGSQIEETGEFQLAPGVIVAEFRHDGAGDFKVELVTESGVQAPSSALGLGMSLLNTLGWVSSEIDGNWLAFESRGRVLLLNMCALPYGGEFFLRIRAADRWRCRIFQPYPSQAWCTFDRAPKCSGGIGQLVLGPFVSSSNLLQCSVQLTETADMDITAFSLDGSSETVIVDGRLNQGAVELRAELAPDTEYLLLVNCSGNWQMSFVES